MKTSFLISAALLLGSIIYGPQDGAKAACEAKGGKWMGTTWNGSCEGV